MNEAEESNSLDKLDGRLEERFPHLPPHTIRDVVTKAHRDLDQARIRDFVTVLVEREAVSLLKSPHRGTNIAPPGH